LTPTSEALTTSTGGFLPNMIPEVEPHALIGISLCLGFVFMLLVDHCFGGHSHAPAGIKTSILSFMIHKTKVHNIITMFP
jgi:hypothetical protein